MIGSDITEKKGLEEKIFNLDFIIKKVPGYVFWKDINSTLLGCNENFAYKAGLEKPEDIVGKTDYDLPWDKNEAENYVRDDQEVIRTGKPKLHIEETQRYAKRKESVILTNKVPTYDLNGNITGVLGIFMDITKIKQAERALKREKEKAELANLAKTQFIANMEHDLRTPCSGIAEMSKILEAMENDTQKKEILKDIVACSSQLLKILNSILDFEKINAGTIPIQLEEFNIHYVLASIYAMNKLNAKKKKLQLSINCKKNVPAILIGDEHRISRILLNLVVNAIKFTHNGSVKIIIETVEQSGQDKAVLKFIVRDTGIGIPETELGNIFDKFTKLIPSNIDSYQGSGLGLSIVKRFVKDLKGEIKVKSKINKGSTFTCIIPFKMVSKKRTSCIKNNVLKKKMAIKTKFKILLIEDDILAQKIAYILIKEQLLHDLDIAKTGEIALDFSKQKKYDLIFMDIGLPDINGYEISRQIKKLPESKNKDTVIVALTSHNLKIIQKESIAAGMKDFLVKPITIEKIQYIIIKWILKEPLHEQTFGNKVKIDKQQDEAIDFDYIIKQFNGNRQFIHHLLESLGKELSIKRKEIKNAINDNNFFELKKLAHKLCSITIYSGTYFLNKLVKQLEKAAQKKDIIQLRDLHPQFESATDAVIKKIDEYNALQPGKK